MDGERVLSTLGLAGNLEAAALLDCAAAWAHSLFSVSPSKPPVMRAAPALGAVLRTSRSRTRADSSPARAARGE